MDCPICSSTMLNKDLHGTEIDICPKCKGIWLDEGELKNICGLDPTISRILTCPKCKTQMQIRTVSNVEIDICPKCRSIYLDAGELEKLSGIDPQTGKPIKLSIYLEQEFLKELKKHTIE